MNKLKEVRFFKGVTQVQLSISADVHQSRISLIENEYAKPHADEKERLAEALGVKPEDLWGNNGSR